MYCEQCGQKKPTRTASERLKMNIVYHVKNETVREHMLSLVRVVNMAAFDRGVAAAHRGYIAVNSCHAEER